MMAFSRAFNRYNTIDEDPLELLSSKREIELIAMKYMTDAIRCQGKLTPERRELLSQVATFLNITEERYKGEIMRAVFDNHLSKIAEVVEGPNTDIEWMQEGRVEIRAPPKTPEPTIYTQFADEFARKFLEAVRKKNSNNVNHNHEVDGDEDDDDEEEDEDNNSGVVEIPRVDETGIFKILQGTPGSLPVDIVIHDPFRDMIEKMKRERQRYHEALQDDEDTSSAHETGSTSSESELSTMSNTHTSNEEKQSIQEDLDIINSVKQEKSIEVVSISEDDTNDGSIPTRDEDILNQPSTSTAPSTSQIPSTSAIKTEIETNENFRKRKLSTDESPVPQKIPTTTPTTKGIDIVQRNMKKINKLVSIYDLFMKLDTACEMSDEDYES